MSFAARSFDEDERRRAGGRGRMFCLRAMRLVAWLLAVISSLSGVARAQRAKPSQFDVQAVYLYDFAKFVRWPAAVKSSAPLGLCVAGQTIYVEALMRIVAGEQIGGRPVTVRGIERPEQEDGCAIVFIGAAMKDHLKSLVAASEGKPILTVSDVPGFLEQGGMIQFVLTENRVRFAVNLGPVDRNGLALSSELLKVALTVNGKPSGGGAP
jgi:hypothetical protein